MLTTRASFILFLSPTLPYHVNYLLNAHVNQFLGELIYSPTYSNVCGGPAWSTSLPPTLRIQTLGKQTYTSTPGDLRWMRQSLHDISGRLSGNQDIPTMNQNNLTSVDATNYSSQKTCESQTIHIKSWLDVIFYLSQTSEVRRKIAVETK